MYTKAFLLCLRKNIKKKRRDEEIGKQTKWNGNIEYETEKVNKLDKSKRSSHSPVAFKHDCLLETYLELWRKKKAIPGHLYFSKNG